MATALARPAMFAHQGGWDEIALIAVPVLVIAALLALAKRRVDAHARDDAGDDAAFDQDVGGTGRDR